MMKTTIFFLLFFFHRLVWPRLASLVMGWVPPLATLFCLNIIINISTYVHNLKNIFIKRKCQVVQCLVKQRIPSSAIISDGRWCGGRFFFSLLFFLFQVVIVKNTKPGKKTVHFFFFVCFQKSNFKAESLNKIFIEINSFLLVVQDNFCIIFLKLISNLLSLIRRLTNPKSRSSFYFICTGKYFNQ